MMKRIAVLSLTLLCLLSCKKTDYSSYVDTSIGTGGHGHVFAGANVPFGLVQLGPTSIPQEWDWCSGYHASDSTVIGFSHTHLSGTGIGDLFDVTVMPVTGDVTYARGNEDDPLSGLWSYALRSEEISEPGYYSVPLLRYGIKAEMTATKRTGFHRYTFPSADDAAIVFDLLNGGCWDSPTETFIEPVGRNALRGYRFSKGWADNQKIFFYAEFSEGFADFQIIEREMRDGGKLPFFGRADFGRVAEGKEIMLKVALSPVSMEGAYENLKAESSGWDFEAVRKAARDTWNSELGRIHIETENSSDRTVFYTALYHSMIAPAVFDDVDGRYRGADDMIHDGEAGSNYTIFSLWDTYRAAMPLYSIFQSGRYEDFINTMLRIYEEQGKLPVWHLMGCETNCMVGNPGIPPVADAIVKGFDIDINLAFEAMVNSALRPDRGEDLRIEYGYIPFDMFNESIAYDMEYALADGAIAAAADYMIENGQAEYQSIAEQFRKRSHSYRNYFDPETGFMRGRDSKGDFREDFSPFSASHRANDYCEGNAWQYTWLAPHDVEGLMECFEGFSGIEDGRGAFLMKLDSLFTVSSALEGEDVSPDISGMIGQYAHGNEPSHHILYLYAMAGQPWKTAEKVREVLTTLYHDRPDGLSGNEDVGQMSSWYILSALGFYEVEPGTGRYWFGSPLFDKASIDVAGGTFTVKALSNSRSHKYIKSIKLNGEPYDKLWISHKDIAAGGELVFEMTDSI